ncbi:sensor histidine kinase [Prauserella endophytica]|uniref:histidine kinase n=1 Tax=Prauserella endophytica TaxID=1592324 RepID=A0ABY2S8B9_9PSEU|nr:histidine kinase [Prauserella endophytica]PXY30347.1 histidine kinase [Prauserella coralliicola]TKG72157.1 sensor histidine kinase [Prauserella endophytica]
MPGELFCATRTALPVVVVGAGAAATTWGEFAAGTRGWPLAIDLAVVVAGCCLVPVLLRRPAATTLVITALALSSPAGTPAASVGVLHTARTRPFPVAVGVAAVSVAAHLLRWLWRPLGGLSFWWWLALVVVAHTALLGWGALAEARRALIASLRERAERAEAEQGRRVAEARAAERTRIAREMHDVLAHRLSLLATYAGALEYRPGMPAERVSEAAGVIRRTVHQALDELRDVIALLRDDPVSEGTDRPMPALADLPELVAESRSAGTVVDVRDGLTDTAALPGTTGRTAYRVLQEALTNARKHAPGQPVSIALDGTPGTRLVITVSNPLADRAAVSSVPGAGTGLVGLTERVRLAGGRLDHRATAREFRLHAWLPWPA